MSLNGRHCSIQPQPTAQDQCFLGQDWIQPSSAQLHARIRLAESETWVADATDLRDVAMKK